METNTVGGEFLDNMTSPNNMQFSLPKQRGTNLPEFTPGSTSTAAGHVSANGTPRAHRVPRRSLGTRPTTQYVPIIGNPTHRDQTEKTKAGPSFQPGVPAQKTNFASWKALNKVRLGSILPNKPQIQFKPPRRNVLRSVKEFDLTPENATKLSIDELIDITGIPPGDDIVNSNTGQVKPFWPSLNRVTNTTSQNGTKNTGEKDSVESFQVPNEDDTTTNKYSEIKRNDGLQVKATGIPKTDGCRSNGLAVPCKLTKNGAKTTNGVSGGEIETEPTDKAQKKNGAMVSPNHLRFPPRLPPIRLKGGNSSPSRDKTTKVEQSRAAALTTISKKAQKQALELDGAHAAKKRFISEQDGGKQSEVTPDGKNVSKRHDLLSYNNNGNTCPDGDIGQVYECRQERLNESPPNQDPRASLPQLYPDQLDDMLNIMIDMTTEERPTSQTRDHNSTLKNGNTQRGSAVGRSPPTGFNLSNANIDLSHTFPGMKHQPQSSTGFKPSDMNPVDESPVQSANASCFSSPDRYLTMRPIVPPPPGFEPMKIPPEVLQNVTSKKRAKSSSYFANEKLGQSHSKSGEWDIGDWCYVVQWPDGWRATNRDASYLPADVREQLHIGLSRLEGVTPRQPKPVDQPSNRNDPSGTSQRVPHEETSKSINGNNNHKQTMSNSSKGKTYTVGRFSINAPSSPKPQSEETLGSPSITNRQKEATNLTSTDQTMTNPHKLSSRYASDVMISSDSNWSQSTVDWKVDIEELLLLLSGPSDDIRTSEFQSVQTSFPSICTEQATLCGVDSNISAKHSSDDEFPPKHEVKRKYHSAPIVRLTLPNGDLELVELSSTNEVEILFDTLTDVEEDSLEKYLSEGTWTDQEMDFFWRPYFTRNQTLHLTKKDCEVTSGKAVHGLGGGFTENSGLHGQEEYDAKQELDHGNSAAKSVKVHHDENKSSRNGVGRMMQKIRNHSLASESYSSTNRLKKSKELSESSTGLPFPVNDRTKTDSDNWQVQESRETSVPPDVTESQASVRSHQQSRTPNQIAKVLQVRTSADSSDEYDHPRDRPTCDSFQQEGTVEQQCVQDPLQNTHEEGDVIEGFDSTEEDSLNPQPDCETEQYPLPINWKPAPKPADVKKEKIHHPQDFGNDENCPLPNKEKGTNADEDVSSTIQYNADVLEGAVKEHHAFVTCSPRVTKEESKLAIWKIAPKQRRHTEAYDAPLAEVEHDPPSTVHGEASLKEMMKKVELVTTSSSSESGDVINDTWSQTMSIEVWMRINDEQLDHAIKMERINGGRPAIQVAPSTNTYQRILRWLRASDFSLIPREKRAKQSRKH